MPSPTALTLRQGLTAGILEDRACSETIDAAMAIHRALGARHAVATYRNALAVELKERQLSFHRQPTFSVVYRTKVVGSFVADLVVEDRILIQVASEPVLSGHHKTETLRGVVAADIQVGLAFNFGGEELAFARIL